MYTNKSILMHSATGSALSDCLTNKLMTVIHNSTHETMSHTYDASEQMYITCMLYIIKQ